MAATQAESQRSEANVDQSPTELGESRALLQNGTDKNIGRVPSDGVLNTKNKPMSTETNQRDSGEVPGHDRGNERPTPDQYGQYRYAESADPYYSQRPGFPHKPRPPPQQRFFPGQSVAQAQGPTPTLNSLLQSSGAPPHRYPNSYEQPPAGYAPGPGWPPPRPLPPSPYNPPGSPYRNSTAARGAAPGYGGPGYVGGAPGAPQQPPSGYGPPGAYSQRYPPPPGPPAPNSRPPYSPHQGYERGGSPQPPSHPPPPHSPGAGGALSPPHDPHHPPHPAAHQQHPPPHGAQQPPHQGYPPPPRPAQPSTPNAHDPDSDLTGQNSNDSGGSGGAGRASTPHLRPTPSPTGSSGSRSMSPAVGTQNVPMPPRPSSSQSDGSGPTSRPGTGPAVASGPPPAGAGGPPPGAMAAQPYPPHHGYKPAHYPPQPYPYPPRNHHPYPYPGYRPPPPPPHPSQHYPPLKQPSRHMGPPPPHHEGAGVMPPPTAPDAPHDNGAGPAPPATALVTTGPDGAPLDEGSQQSTLSNASAASGEEGPCGTPKSSRKDGYGGVGSSAPSPSPGGGSHSSAHDDYDASPSPWPRPPSSPVFNSHIPPEPYRSKQKSDSLGKLYDMDDSPERRGWVERLLAFMEERRTPIAACPTISKQPLDLYRLYLLVRERGGFVEVTKNKTWKDIAGLLGIGASSSAAYTLRKHYTKNLLAYECHFDRGGIDPQPIINQVEATTKKKSGKGNNAPSPAGTSNSQETFPVGGSGAPVAPMDGYGGQYGGYPPQPNQAQGYQQGYGYEYSSPYPSNRPVYPPYGPEADRGYGGGEYRYGGGYGGRYPAPGAPPPAGTPPPGQPYPDYYRAPHPPHPPHPPPAQPHEYGGKGMGPPPVGAQPRRHPDFANKDAGAYATSTVAVAGAPRPQYAQQWPGSGGQFPRAPASPAPPAPWRPPPGSAPAPPPPGACPWPAYQPPGQSNAGWGTGGPAPGPGVPPGAESKPYLPAAAPSPGAIPIPGPVGQVKRELTFPPDCVEATVPSGEKRRRYTKADVAPIDAWRIMMALKSGLLAETCWALDILNILLFDDNCISYFGLQHMPGLLDLLLEHFHKSLSDVFDTPTPENEPWYLPPNKEELPPKEESKHELPDPTDRVKILSGENFTFESRRHRQVTYKSDEELFAPDDGLESDVERVEDAVMESWQFGADMSFANHVMPCFQGEFVYLPFVKVMDCKRVSEPSPRPPTPVEHPSECESNVEGSVARTENAQADTSPRVKVETDIPDADCDNLESEPMELERDNDIERKPNLLIRDPAGVLKRRRLEDYEDECYTRDEPSLNLIAESREALAKRCISLSNILRGLTFVPGNEGEFSRSGAFLALTGKLLLLHHEHAPRAARAKAYERAVRDDSDIDACCSSLHGESEWWWDTLAQLREDALVCCANIAGSVELAGQPEAVARPLLDGLLHWAVCPAAIAADAPAHAPPSSPLSPRRLALEALCKLCVTDANVDLVLATPPRARISALCASLARDLCRPERPVVREFAVNLLHYLAGGGSGAAREVAMHAPTISQLVAFIERAEQAALGVANQHGVGALRDNPDAMGTSLDMLRRAAATLLRLAEHPNNRALIRRHERRLLSLVMSQILDQKVAHELADVLYQCSRHRPEERLD